MAKLSFPGFEDCSFIADPPFVTGDETLEFLTDIVLTHNGNEDRTRNRAIARQALSFSVRADLQNRQSPLNQALQNIRGPWGVPLWNEAQIVGNVSGTTIAVDLNLSSFAVDNLALVYQNKNDWQVVRILSASETQIVVTPSISLKRKPLVVPINAGTIAGDIGNTGSGFQSVYDFKYKVTNPKPYPTKIAALFALDVSGSMDTEITPGVSRLSLAKADLYETVQSMKGAAVNSNVAVDLSLVLWSGVSNAHNYPNATEEDFDEALALIAAATSGGGTTPYNAFVDAVNFFGTVSPNPGDRSDIFFFITDAGESNNAAAAYAADMIARTGAFAYPNDVDIYGVNIDFASTVQADKIDNTPDEPVANVTAENPTAMFDLFIRVIEPLIGRQHKGFEVITSLPVDGRSLSKSINKIEDIVDFDLGRFETLSPWLNPRVGVSHGYFIDGLRELVSFKRFLYRRAGKHGSFFLPTFEHDVKITSFSVDRLSAFISADDFAAYDEGRSDLAFRFTNDNWQFVSVVGVTAVGLGGYRLDFSKPIAQGLNYIERVSYMGKARLDSDQIEISYIGDNCAECSLSMLEISK